jgi:hypothetical protein
MALGAVSLYAASEPLSTQTSADSSAKPHPAQHKKAKKKADKTPSVQPASAPAPAPAPTPKPETPNWPVNNSPSKATIGWDSRGLRIVADNSSLQQILKEVSDTTGIEIEGLSGDERVFGSYGPGLANEVLSQLLHGSSYNVMMIGEQSHGTPRQLVLSSRENGAAAAANYHPRAKAASDDDDDDAQEPEPPSNSASPRPGGGAPHTPQQMMDDMRQRQQDQQPPQDDDGPRH